MAEFISGENQRLELLERETERVIDSAAALLQKRMSDVLQDLLRGEARQFTNALESLLRQTLERTLNGIFTSHSDGPRNRGFSLTSLQNSVDFLTELERGKRNT